MPESNVYQKLAAARLKLKEAGLKPSGKNKGVGFSYFDLQDILPHTTKIEKELGLLSVVSFSGDGGMLTVYNVDKPEEKIEFKSPVRDAELRGCHPVQNLGAVETYVRRYLYLLAYEIVETDALDLSQDKNSANRSIYGGQPQKKAEEKPEKKEENIASTKSQPMAEEAVFPPESYKCAVCGKKITEKLFNQTVKAYGVPLCSKECKEFIEKADGKLAAE